MAIIVSILSGPQTQGNTNVLIFSCEGVTVKGNGRRIESKSGVQLGMNEQDVMNSVKYRKGDLLFHLSLESKFHYQRRVELS